MCFSGSSIFLFWDFKHIFMWALSINPVRFVGVWRIWTLVGSVPLDCPTIELRAHSPCEHLSCDSFQNTLAFGLDLKFFSLLQILGSVLIFSKFVTIIWASLKIFSDHLTLEVIMHPWLRFRIELLSFEWGFLGWRLELVVFLPSLSVPGRAGRRHIESSRVRGLCAQQPAARLGHRPAGRGRRPGHVSQQPTALTLELKIKLSDRLIACYRASKCIKKF